MATLPIGITIFNFPTIADSYRGDLTFVEGNTHVPFEIKRVFWIYGVDNPLIERGGHAHKECEQVMISVYGSVIVEINGLTYWLCEPSQGVYVPPESKVKMSGFSDDCVLMVLCSHHFSEEDYVRETNQVSEPVAR